MNRSLAITMLTIGLLATTLGFAPVGAAPTPAPGVCPDGPTPFADLRGDWSDGPIACLWALGITTGTSSTTFSPNDAVTRKQMAGFISRFYELKEQCLTPRTPFADVERDWSEDAIACLYALDITTGTASNAYSPHQVVTRKQLAGFISRLWEAVTGSTCSTPRTPFADVERDWSEDAIACLYALDVTTGTASNAYSPHRVVTRAEVAAMLARLWEALSPELFNAPDA